MSTKIVIINGYPTAGKDTFCNFMRAYASEFGEKITSISTIDPVIPMAMAMGWDGEKTSANRKFLSQLKSITSEWCDLPFTQTCAKIGCLTTKRKPPQIIFIHCREPEEIDRFVKKYNATTVFIKRPNNKTKISNCSDARVENYFYDYIVENNSLAELAEGAALLYELLLKN